MGTCAACNGEMKTADGCTEKQISFTMDPEVDAIPVGEEQREIAADIDGRCSDCGAMEGEFHHPGCDWEECPKCGQQLLGCDCSVLGHIVDGEETPRFDRWGRELKHGG